MKYQDESTKVSIVSVSRRAGLPHVGQCDVQEVARACSAGCRVPSGTQSSGSTTGRSFSGTGTAPQRVAMDDRDRRAPVALAARCPSRAGARWSSSRRGPWRCEVGGDRVDRRLVAEAVVVAGVDAVTPRSLSAYQSCQCVGRERLAVDVRSPAGSAGRTSSRTRSRARRAPARPSPRRRRSSSARSCRPRRRPARR